MNEFKEGAFIVAKTTGKDILPIVVNGTWELTNSKKFGFKIPARLSLTVLDPMPAEEVRKRDIKDISDTLKERIESAYIADGGIGY